MLMTLQDGARDLEEAFAFSRRDGLWQDDGEWDSLRFASIFFFFKGSHFYAPPPASLFFPKAHFQEEERGGKEKAFSVR